MLTRILSDFKTAPVTWQPEIGDSRSSYQCYDVMLLINGIPCVQMELKTLDVTPHRAMQQLFPNPEGSAA